LKLVEAANVKLVPPRSVEGRRLTGELPATFVATKLDAPAARETLNIFREFYGSRLPLLPISSQQDLNLAELRKTMLAMLNVIRVYSKKPGKKPDLSVPYILRKGAAVLEAAAVVHKDFAERLKYARLWRRGGLEGQMVGRDHPLEDGDVLELHA